MSTYKHPLAPVLTILLTLGLVDAWAGRRSFFGGDSVSYLDMASGIANGDFWSAVNGHYGPLYPILVAVVTSPFQSDTGLEFTAVRVLNFLIFVITLGTFQIFLTRFLDLYFGELSAESESAPPMSRSQFALIAYAIFSWGCLFLTIVSRINPDMCLAATTFAAAATLLSFARGNVSLANFASFGAILGVGYLFKAVFFPLSFLYLMAAALEPHVRAVRKRLLLSLAVFLVIASPLITTLSIKYGHLTFGETGKFNFWWIVNRVRTPNQGIMWVHWQGDPPGSGTPLHSTRKVADNPEVFEFGSPIVATYPPWYDPSYWNEGANVRFDIGRLVVQIAKNVGAYVLSLSADRFFLVAMSATLLLLIGFPNLRFAMRSVSRFRSLWIVAIGSIGIYVPFIMLPRYLVAGSCFLMLLLLASIRLPTSTSARAVGAPLVALFFLGAALDYGPRLTNAATLIVHSHGNVRDDRWQVAEELKRLGVPPGTPVAAVDPQEDVDPWPPAVASDWARLARVRIVSEILYTRDKKQQFWRIPTDRQETALQALRASGAKVVIASGVPDWANTSGWTRIRETDYYFRFLQ